MICNVFGGTLSLTQSNHVSKSYTPELPSFWNIARLRIILNLIFIRYWNQKPENNLDSECYMEKTCVSVPRRLLTFCRTIPLVKRILLFC